MPNLEQKHCLPCENLSSALDLAAIQNQLDTLSDKWDLSSDHTTIFKTFQFKNYYHVIAFVNAIAWVTHQENHHPDLEVSYNHCLVRYSTHALNGLSENDFICAEKVNNIFQPYKEKQNERK